MQHQIVRDLLLAQMEHKASINVASPDAYTQKPLKNMQFLTEILSGQAIIKKKNPINRLNNGCFFSLITRNLKLGVCRHWVSSSAVPSRIQMVSAFIFYHPLMLAFFLMLVTLFACSQHSFRHHVCI